MDRSAFARWVAALSLGKRLPDGVYVHVETLPRVPSELHASVEEARLLAQLEAGTFHVVKFAIREWKVSLLAYPGFFDEAFPSLSASWAVDLEGRTVAHRAYSAEGNPPVLHRKEALLPPEHPRVAEFEALTAAAERLGLLTDAKTIGTRKAWEARLRRLGVHLDGHRLIETLRAPADEEAVEINRSAAQAAASVAARESHPPDQFAGDDPPRATDEGPRAAGPIEADAPGPPVLRHRTALQRYSLSTPMQALWKHGYLDGRCTVFDYGCGRGDDLRLLKELGVDASGWDPHFAAQHEKRQSDVVNLGFVINVIEDLKERREALMGAFSLSRKVLAVSALIGGRTAYEQHRLFRDGVLTTRGTFQKYFSQQELRDYLETTVGRDPIAVAPGVFFVFRDDAEEQRFLAARQTLARCPVRLPKAEAEPRARRLTRWEQNRELLEDFWGRCLELGRLPKAAEYARLVDLRDALGSPQAVLRKLREERGEDSLEAARRVRMDDLLVYLALNVFERRKSFRRLPETLQRDVATFWGSYATAQEQATKLLFSLGNPKVILEACDTAAAQGIGYLHGDHSLQLHSSLVPRLPAVLRIYVGCASRLYGEVEAADLVKIHVQSGKLSLMTYDDFAGKPLPRLLERVKINLRNQFVQFFDYNDNAQVQLLYTKSRYIDSDFDRYQDQVEFEKALAVLNLDMTGYGPDARTLEEALRRDRLEISEFQLVRATKRRST